MKYLKSEYDPRRKEVLHTFLGGYAHDKEFVISQCTQYPNRFLHKGVHTWIVDEKFQFSTAGTVDGWVKLSEIHTIATMINILRNIVKHENIHNGISDINATLLSASLLE